MIAFCTTCKGRVQHLQETLPENLAYGDSDAKFIVLDYGSQDNLLDYLQTNHAGEIAGGRLVVYSFPSAGTFKMAHAKNMAHRLGMLEGANILCNLDADNFTGPGFTQYIEGHFERDPSVFLWANRNQPSATRYPKGCNGRIVVSSAAFLKSGGYDEQKYNSWGPDDKDFHFRLRRFGYTACEIGRQYLNVVLHNDKMRFKEYPEVVTVSKDEGFQVVCDKATIANFGNFGCGAVFRNFDFSRPIELAPIPTRIFGIGMHKTGTTSLHTALAMLGYDSAHWKSVKWAKNIWVEMTSEGRSLTIEKHYALSDLPIPLLYKQLDKAYPGSKFILTVRNEERWLRSVKTHWSKWNGFKDTWKKEDAFAQQIHKELYGQSDFDPSVFLPRYRRHNAEVREYFKGRSDLLVMDVEKPSSQNWRELCGFLGKPIPTEPYPIAFSSYAEPEPEVISGSGDPSSTPLADTLEKVQEVLVQLAQVLKMVEKGVRDLEESR